MRATWLNLALCSLVAGLTSLCSSAGAADIMLDCQLKGFAESDPNRHMQILIEESTNTVLFHAQAGRRRPMVITENNEQFVWGRDEYGSIVITKRDLRFIRGWTEPAIGPNGKVTGVSGSLEGSCSANPFAAKAQAKK